MSSKLRCQARKLVKKVTHRVRKLIGRSTPGISVFNELKIKLLSEAAGQEADLPSQAAGQEGPAPGNGLSQSTSSVPHSSRCNLLHHHTQARMRTKRPSHPQSSMP